MKVWTIVRKEWEEVFRNKMVLFSILGLPPVFTLIGVGTVYFTRSAIGDAEMSEADAQEIFNMAGALCADLDPAQCMDAFMGSMHLFLFLMLPMILPAVFGAYSVVGEKTQRTLEPLLATPITTWELLTGKVIAALGPTVLATWVSVGLFYAGCGLIIDAEVMGILMSPAWLLALGLMAPLLALLTMDLAVLVSSRVQDPRVAQQLTSFLVLPMVVLMVAQTMGKFTMEITLVTVSCGVLFLLDITATYFAIQLFQREHILTRWK